MPPTVRPGGFFHLKTCRLILSLYSGLTLSLKMSSMKSSLIARDNFVLGLEEYEREWLDVKSVAEVSDVPIKTVRNWTDRGFIDIDNINPGTNEKRLYSLKSAVQIASMHSLITGGLTAPRAQNVLVTAVSIAIGLISPGITVEQMTEFNLEVRFYGTPSELDYDWVMGHPSKIYEKVLERAKKNPEILHLSGSIFPVSHIIRRCLLAYLKVLERSRVKDSK